jgi:hypothetical protein
MKIIIPIVAITYSVVFGYMSHLGIEYFIPPLSLIVSYYLIVRYREQIADWFLGLGIKNGLFLYLVATLPFMIFEENINCFPPEAGGCRLFPMETIPFMTGQMIIIYFLIKKFKFQHPTRIVWAYAVFGVLWEITVGVAGEAFRALPPIWFIIIFAYTFMSYAYYSLVPVTLATRKFGRES